MFLISTSAFTFAPLAARNGGTPCSDLYYRLFGCSVPFSNPGIRIAGSPSREGYPGIIIIIDPNHGADRTGHLVAGTVEPVVGRPNSESEGI